MTRGLQRRTFEAICDTFAPGSAATCEAVPRPDARRVELALGAFWLRTPRFAKLPHDERERILLRWAESRLPLRRTVFHGLRRLALGAAYTSDPARWQAIGYPGPPGRVEGSSRRMRPLAVQGDLTLDCDVVVVGSGAGGGPAAAVLATAGLDVIVIEAGGHFDESDFDGDELASHRSLYADLATAGRELGIVAGRCVGGGTLVNYASSFRTPDDVRSEWGAPFEAARFDEALDEVCRRLGVTCDESRPSPRDRLLRDGLTALGWHAGVVPRAVRGCEQDGRCGFCAFGCPFGAKQSTLQTWLADAAAAGARVLADTTVERIAVRDGAAAGVLATHRSGARVHVSSRAVVCSAGAVETPALLRRSGLGNDHVGRHLRLHPGTFAFGVFDEEVEPWSGTTQAVYSDEHRDLDGFGHGVKYMTQPLHPGFVARMMPWRSARTHLATMTALRRTGVVVVQLRDRDEGEVRVGRSGRPVVHYRLSDRDAAHGQAGVEGAATILRAAGAQEVFEPAPPAYGSVHLMGTAAIGRACDSEGRLHGVRRVVVCDGSTFPSASGVNPMITIEAISLVNARALAADLT